jgi:hypothetical protein
MGQMQGTACVVQPRSSRSALQDVEGRCRMETGQQAQGQMRETDVWNRVCSATVKVGHGLRQLAAARGENSKLQYAEGRKLELLTGNSVACATIKHGIASWTCS